MPCYSLVNTIKRWVNDFKGEALKLLKQYLKDERMVKHCLAVEAFMRALAKRLDENVELWAVSVNKVG